MLLYTKFSKVALSSFSCFMYDFIRTYNFIKVAQNVHTISLYCFGTFPNQECKHLSEMKFQTTLSFGRYNIKKMFSHSKASKQHQQHSEMHRKLFILLGTSSTCFQTLENKMKLKQVNRKPKASSICMYNVQIQFEYGVNSSPSFLSEKQITFFVVVNRKLMAFIFHKRQTLK